MSNKLQFSQLASAALAQFDTVMRLLGLSGGAYEGNEYSVLNPTRLDNAKGSFKINKNSGKWSDFATDQKGGDLVSLAAYIWGISNGEAYKRLADDLSFSSDISPTKNTKTAQKASKELWYPVLVPSNAPNPPEAHFKHGKPSSVYKYLNENGESFGFIYRFDLDEGKQFSPLTYCQNNHGKSEWRFQGFAEPRPLYGLDRLAKMQSAPVLLCEGEKAVNAAESLFPSYVCMTWAGGANGYAKTDFSPLKGRVCLLWPDNDKVGIKAMLSISEILKQNSAQKVEIINPAIFSDKQGYDAADALADGFTDLRISDLKSTTDFYYTPTESEKLESIETKQPSLSLASVTPIDSNKTKDAYFEMKLSGLYARDKEGAPPRCICPHFDIISILSDEASESWRFVIEFKNAGGVKLRHVIPFEQVTDEGREIVQALQRKGFVFMGKVGHLFTSYLRDRKRLTEAEGKFKMLAIKTGWHDVGDIKRGAFVTADKTYGLYADQIIYAPDDFDKIAKLSMKGNFETWQKNVAAYAVGNSRLCFSIACAFAAPLMAVCGIDGGGVHFKGASSTGKTTCQIAASSVYGLPTKNGFSKSWKTTDSALEQSACAHNDMILPLDEIAQVDPKQAGDCVYTLGNGIGRSRATRNGGVRKTYSWLTFIFSAGEVGLSDLMQEVGKRVKAGQEVRLLEIPAEVSDGTIYETNHDFASGAALSDHISKYANENYGHAFDRFITKLCEPTAQADAKKLFDKIKMDMQYTLTESRKRVSGEVSRAAVRFALIAAAGELATRWGITGWAENEALKASQIVFEAWKNNRGGLGSLEDKKAIDQVLSELALKYQIKCSDNRRPFADDNHSAKTQGERWGVVEYYESDEPRPNSTIAKKSYVKRVLIFPPAFKVLCKGHESKRVGRLLCEQGFLDVGNDGRSTQSLRIDGETAKTTRVYVFNTKFLEFGDCEA